MGAPLSSVGCQAEKLTFLALPATAATATNRRSRGVGRMSAPNAKQVETWRRIFIGSAPMMPFSWSLKPASRGWLCRPQSGPNIVVDGPFTIPAAELYVSNAHGRVRDYDHPGRFFGLEIGWANPEFPWWNSGLACGIAGRMISMKTLICIVADRHSSVRSAAVNMRFAALRRHSPKLVLLMSLFATGCASLSGWETESSSKDFVNGTRILTEVIMVATRNQVIAEEGLLKGWRKKLISAGYSDKDIVDGSEITVWSYCYGHNSGVPLCAHHGHYVAHVPPELRHGIQGDPDANSETSGDLVEIELKRSPTGELVGNLVAVYRKSGDWGSCRDVYLERGEVSSALLALMVVGPPRANWIECDHAESDGWVRQPVIGAPLSHGPPVSQWVKFP